MLIARAPVRVSFFGGGTDLPAYYLQHGGAVLSTTLDRYIYVILNVSGDDELQVTSSDYGTFYRRTPGRPLLWDGGLPLVSAVLDHFDVSRRLSLFVASEVPPGTGLGSSSAVAVAIIKAVSTARGLRLSPHQVADLACEIEIEKLGNPIGVQDQYAAAFGGFNWMTFGPAGVEVQPLDLPQPIISRLERNLVLGFMGSSHDSSTILAEQSKSSRDGNPGVIQALDAVHELAGQGLHLLTTGRLDHFGRLLDEAWQHKRQFASGVTSGRIEHCYKVARKNGALGGKIAGAGGGGFLMVYCEDGAALRVQDALEAEGVRCMKYHFESDGARVLFHAGLRLEAGADGAAVATMPCGESVA
jgi:D-glycero-alpha-D-manno-heptose-7-phosphate kinase